MIGIGFTLKMKILTRLAVKDPPSTVAQRGKGLAIPAKIFFYAFGEYNWLRPCYTTKKFIV